MEAKGKGKYANPQPNHENPLSSTTPDINHLPLADQYYKIVGTECERDLFELHHRLKKTYPDQGDDINLYKSTLPIFMLPHVHHFPNFIIWCLNKYNAAQRTIMALNGDILVSISPETINQMLLILENHSLIIFLVSSLMDICHTLIFP